MLPKKEFPFFVTLKLDKAKPVRHDNAKVTMDGTLKLSGTLTDLLLEGQLQIVNGEFRIPERLPPEIVQLDVEEIHRPGGGAAEGKGTPRKAAPPRSRHLKLDVSLESSGQIFLTGRGLNSEWKGILHARGNSDAPVVTGNLSVVRGHADFLGKRFDLGRGVIAFDGAVPPSPQLDVLAEARTKSITAQLEIGGPIKNPNIELSSDPALPSDEILSRLLFGRSVTDITPFQAVQLALAANTLAGGGGFDLMGRTRKILHVDQLEVKNLEGDKDEATVSAGKYLTETVYLEVEKGLGPKSGKASVEWEATPNIGIETEVGENADAGMGINWKWNY
jgi:translocation and assembly module TamB